jgi:SPP1 family predicted phage head-tail adaptor
MLAIGTMKYYLKFFEIVSQQSSSGAITKVKNNIFNCKASKISEKGGFKVEAKEIFHENYLEFKIRYNKLFNDNLIVNYNNTEYRIISSENNKFDNTISITIQKINT